MNKRANKTNNASGGKKQHNIFNRITLIVILGLFVLLVISMLITAGVTALIARYWHAPQDNYFVYGLVVLVVSILVGIALSVAFSAILVRSTHPYIEALQKIAECDFSVRVKDSPIFANVGIADNVNSLAKQLGSVETLREDFVSNFSHEFKTPIVSISGFATLLKNPNLSSEEKAEYLETIIDESNRLVRLSESVLMLTRLDSQTIVKEKFLLDEQIRQSMLLFERPCSVKNIEMSADLDEISIFNEKTMLSQVWVNLLSNAVKFTPAGGKIDVIAKGVKGAVVVQIKDNGCGMDEETKNNIFNKFFQGDRSHATEGNGLGLSIVKKVCELLSLKIEVESVLNEGTTFSVTIPVTNIPGSGK
ncbi:MAG: HAMP domain-containing histidine kinase [Corallococcus sp.]|nr:HAMP domain-containing histidine kinase [Corallococcus sp.]MCM1358969.1 HAMP domain-containing histidine kinase [Corallococcus sp.]MCM1394958.1 HAMP domain-containing histidine kinase [Corallococcus sp.]